MPQLRNPSNSVEDREGLPLALAALRDGEAEGLVVAKLDRLARSLTIQEVILSKTWQLGGSAFAVDSGEILRDDPSDPMRTAMRQMAGVFTELERRMISKRMADGRQHKADQGGYAGGQPPFGWRVEEGELVEDPVEQETLRRIRQLHADGLSLRQIADALTAEGRSTRRGGAWRVQTLAQIEVFSPGIHTQLRGAVGVAGQGFGESSAPCGAGPRCRLRAGGTRHFAGAAA